MRSLPARAGLVLVLATLALAVAGPWVWGDAAARIDPDHIVEGHGSAHFLGTDDAGRDMLARTLAASRLTLELAGLATLLGVVLGVPLGALPAVLPSRAARPVSATISFLVAFPGLLLAMFGAIITGAGARGAVVGIGLAAAPALARVTQTLAASVGAADYVRAARVLGVSRPRILVRHILPNIAEPVILSITAQLGYNLLGLATLSLLGLGVQPLDYDWGRLMHDALPRVQIHPEVIAGPALAVALAGTGFALAGESLARAAARTASPPRGEPRVDLPIGRGPLPGAAVLSVRNLTVGFGAVTPVRDVSFDLAHGELAGLVGESGSGKSLTALAIGGLVPHPGRVLGEIILDGRPLAAHSRRELGTALAMVFQDPMASLNPALRVGSQLAEVATAHQDASRAEAWKRAVDRLGRVHLPEPGVRARQRPHELSGGMRQRAVIAMGLMGTPKLVVADEPTTALDVTVQRRVLDLLAEVNDDTGAAALLISHDLAVVATLCTRVLVMYAGRIVEDLPAADLRRARHPYTRALVASLPDLDTDRSVPLVTVPGRQPSPEEVPPGCAFAPRCPSAAEDCAVRPELVSGVACHHPHEEG
ncbi:dipeptide/oligopeptide/nickel ABC transporter permease/ATP-binding protein [Actinocorallia longicatena]|uniref:Dipeptide/oligopeptide/nickel ABC transporter permease/ATP-binding protein n=1 Tax=Actinocorallia longicatena TaxID=111803 RepID=A0ABP6QLU3_9ACTN